MKQPKGKKLSKKTKTLQIRINKELDKYENKDLCPSKTAKANELLKGVKLPR